MNSECRFINFLEIAPLQRLSCLKIASALWTHSGASILINQVFCKSPLPAQRSANDQKFAEILNLVEKNLTLLPLPPDLNKQVSSFLKPLGIQLIAWVCGKNAEEPIYDNDDNFGHFFHSIEQINSVQWTAQGHIHKARTYQTVLYNINLKQLSSSSFDDAFIITIFKTVANYCLEDYVVKIWDIIPKETQINSFYSKEIYHDYDNHFLAYWIHNIKNEQFDFVEKILHADHDHIYDLNYSVYRNMVSLAIRKSNFHALIFFWQKLSDDEIDASMARWIQKAVKGIKYFDGVHMFVYPDEYNILLFILSQLSELKQRKAFLSHSCVILFVLNSVWPWHSFFTPTLDIVLRDLDAVRYCQLLSFLLNQMASKPFARLVKDFISLSSVHFQRSFIVNLRSGKCYTSPFWSSFFRDGVEIPRLLVAHADAEEKRDIVFNKSPFLFQLSEYIINNKYNDIDNLFEVIELEECFRKSFKTQMAREYLNTLAPDWIINNRYETVDTFLNWTCSSSQHLIQEFKCTILNKGIIVNRFLREENFKDLDIFMNWSFDSEEKVLAFKQQCAYSNDKNVYPLSPLHFPEGKNPWKAFQTYLLWCLCSTKEIERFRVNLSHNPELQNIISYLIISIKAFDITQKLLMWCLGTVEAVRAFKRSLFKDEGVKIFCALALSRCQRVSPISLKQLAYWFYPVDAVLVDEFKNDVTEKVKDNRSFETRYPMLLDYKLQSPLQLLDTFIIGISNIE